MRILRKETLKEKIARKKREHIYAFIRTVGAVFTIFLGGITLLLQFLIFWRIYWPQIHPLGR